jgi:hypothetical protein
MRLLLSEPRVGFFQYQYRTKGYWDRLIRRSVRGVGFLKKIDADFAAETAIQIAQKFKPSVENEKQSHFFKYLASAALHRRDPPSSISKWFAEIPVESQIELAHRDQRYFDMVFGALKAALQSPAAFQPDPVLVDRFATRLVKELKVDLIFERSTVRVIFLNAYVQKIRLEMYDYFEDLEEHALAARY